MPRILIVYGSAYGQTERIVRRIAQGLAQAGNQVSVFKGNHLPDRLSMDEYDGFVIAASVLYGRHQRYIKAFVRGHLDRLNAAPSVFVSVCGAAIGSFANGPAMAQGYADKLPHDTGWRPRIIRWLPGGLPYTRYGLFTRWMMKTISRKTGRPTDTSRDYDFTDWDAVDGFARELAAMFGAAEPAGVAPEAMQSLERGAVP